MHCDMNRNLYLDQPIKNGWCQPIVDIVSYPLIVLMPPGLLYLPAMVGWHLAKSLRITALVSEWGSNMSWRHGIEKHSVILALCAGNSPAQHKRDSNMELLCVFCISVIKSLNKQLSCRWYEITLRSRCVTVMIFLGCDLGHRRAFRWPSVDTTLTAK